MKKEEERGIGDNQFPMADRLLEAWSIMRKEVYKKIGGTQGEPRYDMNDATFYVIEEACQKCLEAADLIDSCLESMGIINEESEYFEDKIKPTKDSDKEQQLAFDFKKEQQ